MVEQRTRRKQIARWMSVQRGWPRTKPSSEPGTKASTRRSAAGWRKRPTCARREEELSRAGRAHPGRVRGERADPARFFVVPGHEDLTAERWWSSSTLVSRSSRSRARSGNREREQTRGPRSDARRRSREERGLFREVNERIEDSGTTLRLTTCRWSLSASATTGLCREGQCDSAEYEAIRCVATTLSSCLDTRIRTSSMSSSTTERPGRRERGRGRARG